MSEISVPYRSRDDSLADVGADGRHLPDVEEREVVRGLIAEAHQLGDRTAGDLLDRLERADPAERRALVDKARLAAGMETLSEIEAHERWLAAQPLPSPAPPRDERGFSFQLCHAPRCSATPIEPSTGLPGKTAARRWWCQEHGHLAAEGDMDDYEVGSGLSLGPSGIVNLAEQRAEAIQERERERSRQARREAREAEKAEAEAQHRADEAARRERLRRETPTGMPLP
jgi:hypothetical protein